MSKKVVKKAGRGKGNAPKTIYVKSGYVNPNPGDWSGCMTYLSEDELIEGMSAKNSDDLVGVYKLVAVKKIAISKASLTDA